MSSVRSSSLGFPRIGEQREWKKNLEAYWNQKISKEEYGTKQKALRLANVQKQKDAGLDLIPVGDFTHYDHVLDTAVAFGLVPDRFSYDGGEVDLDTYFAIARGNDNAVAAEMTKWFDTNYHYIVPELNGREPELVHNRWLTLIEEAKKELHIVGKPVLLGPVTFVKLSKQYGNRSFVDHVRSLLPLYTTVLNELADAGVEWIQVDEPILVGDVSEEEWSIIEEAYDWFAKSAPNAKILLQTYFEGIDSLDRATKLAVAGLGLDFVYSNNLEQLKGNGFPKDKTLAAGLIDGRNIWRTDLTETHSIVEEILTVVSKEQLIVQPSCSLLHVPVTLKHEQKLASDLKAALSFAEEKLTELDHVKSVVNKQQGPERLQAGKEAIEALNQSASRTNKEVREALERSKKEDSKRKVPADKRMELQQEVFKFPSLPTTTIGSFPQSPEVRKTRLQWRRGEISNEAYETFINAEIKRWIDIQEEIDLDVLVHGEFERTDMVEFFGEKLGGFEFTSNGWVQSYGSRCVKPPIIFGDVYFQEAMTVKETLYAQSLTEKPVKGMLTGPVTIYNWSFPRTDLKPGDVVNQIALALEKEVLALESAGITVIQVDEPALREGLPLKRRNWTDYLNQSVVAFQLSVKTVQPQTQIHTHMCYSDFQDIIQAIDGLDADVISIEMSRSHGELITAFEDYTYSKGIGLGVYDIHSPRVPTEEEMETSINRALQVLDQRIFWVNPDCGLKTRKEPETVEALKAMVKAAKNKRKELVVK
ncbi:5-methyltetrahydropteroyltriglutamate--homocysteine S-methyltransferase [Shouchella miscanthi]|uniref:5-methyltetrahydropteroyltriglutamate--homocysteine methyltransferase n=1 Tax=Shouchella miscanthi TaxID=2598861 RepID=A0ABU6NMV5_9BACI|nr:5-methyltetrahydropteroyltriglutamate--homocysteine S-methyltransferase [Shouchella miscanthi]MED4129509.1 5-methyltetrahydropteroyltriglutamate--homocysteine S-methyltransferase [Shouchella miscanthi]